MLQCLGKRAEEGFVSWELSSNREMDGSSWNSRECYCPDSFCAHQLTQDLGTTLSFATSASEKNPHHKKTYSEEGQSKDWIERWIYPRRRQKWRLRSWIFRNAPGPCLLRTQPWWALRLDLSRTWPEQDQTPQASPRKPDTLVCLKHIQMPFPPQKTLFLLGQNSSISGRPNSRHFCLTAFLSAAWHSSRRPAFWCHMWVSFCSLSCHLSASCGSQSGASVTGNMQQQFRKLYCSEVALGQERRKRRAHSCVLAHTDKTATDESEREIWRGDLGRSQKTHFCQQIWTFAIMLWPDASHCFMCYLIKTYEFSIAVLESYLLRRYISPTPTGFGFLYRYKSRVLRKAGTWGGIVSHEHFPAFWKSPTGQVPEGH